jgi:hypothetical protein
VVKCEASAAELNEMRLVQVLKWKQNKSNAEVVTMYTVNVGLGYKGKSRGCLDLPLGNPAPPNPPSFPLVPRVAPPTRRKRAQTSAATPEKMNGHWPYPNYSYDREWRWPWWKFELPPDALFTTLHERFNTRSCPVQDPHAFLLDVRECAQESADVDEFYTKLAERRNRRVLELESAWSDVCSVMDSVLSDSIWSSSNVKCGDIDKGNPSCDTQNDTLRARWAAFCLLARYMSFDRLISFFDGFVRDRRKNEDEKWRKIYGTLGIEYKRKLGSERVSVDGRDRAAPRDPSASATAGPAPNPPDVSAPESALSDGTDAIRNAPAPNAGDTDSQPHPITAADTETESAGTRISPPSTSPCPPRRMRATQKTAVGEGQRQATGTPSGARKRRHSGSEPGQNEEEGDATSGHVPACKKRRMSPSDSGDHSADPASKQTPTRQMPPSWPAPTTTRNPPDKPFENTQ